LIVLIYFKIATACASNPCQNGGTCYGDSNNYMCICPSPWTGPRCDTLFITITTTGFSTISPGKNYILSYLIIMNKPFVIFFNIHVIFVGTMTCTDQPCKNGGTCVTMGTSYSCFCGTNSIYSGKNCDSTTPMPIDGMKISSYN
jgi:hypothetical protein